MLVTTGRDGGATCTRAARRHGRVGRRGRLGRHGRVGRHGRSVGAGGAVTGTGGAAGSTATGGATGTGGAAGEERHGWRERNLLAGLWPWIAVCLWHLSDLRCLGCHVLRHGEPRRPAIEPDLRQRHAAPAGRRQPGLLRRDHLQHRPSVRERAPAAVAARARTAAPARPATRVASAAASAAAARPPVTKTAVLKNDGSIFINSVPVTNHERTRCSRRPASRTTAPSPAP